MTALVTDAYAAVVVVASVCTQFTMPTNADASKSTSATQVSTSVQAPGNVMLYLKAESRRCESLPEAFAKSTF